MALRIISILFMSMAVNIYIAVAPSILGALVDYQGLSTDVAGRLSSYNFWGATVSTIFAIVFLHRPGWNLRLTMLACLSLVILTSLASVWFVGSVAALGFVRFVNGLGAGLGYTVACVAIVGTRLVERSYAILFGAPYLVGGAGLALLPYVYHSSGIEGAFYGMGAINLIACGLLPFFPTTVAGTGETNNNAPSDLERSLLALSSLVLAALFLHYVLNTGVWTYFERIGAAFGMSPERAGALLGPSMSAAIVGMVAAWLLGDRIGYLRPIYIGTVAIALSTLSLLLSSSEIVFGVGTAVFNASITLVTPYFIAILATLVPSGRGVTAANIVTMAGVSVGPFLLSFMIANGDFRPSIVLTAAGFVVVIALLWCFARKLEHTAIGHEQLKKQCGNSVTPG